MMEPRQLAGLTVMLLVGTSRVTRAPAAQFDPSRALLIGIIQSSVEDARVDYAGLKAHPQELKHCLDRVAAGPTAEFKQWTELQQIAFLGSAYTADTNGRALSEDTKARS